MVTTPEPDRAPAPPSLAAAAAITAHGGISRWRQLTEITAHVMIGGTLWADVGHPDVLADARVTADPRRQRLVFDGFGPDRLRSVLEPAAIALYRGERLLDARSDPRSGFGDPAAGWDALQVAYFASYAMWTYLTLPFLLDGYGVASTDVARWPGVDPSWRRIRVDFPSGLDTHTVTQYLNIDADGLLVRHDYDADVLGGAPAVNAASGHRDCDGIVFPTRRRVTARHPDGSATTGPILVSIDFDDIRLH
jgi:hypothetical protein